MRFGIMEKNRKETAMSKHKDPPVKIPIEQWCRLMDVLSCSPDTPIETVILKAETICELLKETRKELWFVKRQKWHPNKPHGR